MTADNSVPDAASADDSASVTTVVAKNSTACAAQGEENACRDSGEASEVSSQNAIVEQVAKLAKLYAAGTPSDEEFRALRARLIELSTSERQASFRPKNLASTGAAASSRDEWFALESHVKAQVGPATKVRRPAKQYFAALLTLIFFIGFGGSMLNEAYGPLLLGASSANGRGAYVPACETRWKVIPSTGHCVRGSLWDGLKELPNEYFFSDSDTASSSLLDQILNSWARFPDSKEVDPLQIRGATIPEADRQVTAEAPDRSKSSPSSSASSRAKPGFASSGPSASEHSKVAQQHATSIRAEDLQVQTKPTPMPETRPETIEGWTLREVVNGTAILEGPTGIWRATRGDTVPGVGRVDSVIFWGNRWIVATTGGLISTP
jgi:hypothetical protein